MLHYFALDPAICRNLNDFRYCTEHCHPSRGRVIADLPPGQWVSSCAEEIQEALAASELQPIKAQSLKRRLSKLRHRILCRPGDGWSYSENWLDDALEEHLKRPYAALVSPKLSGQAKPGCFHPDELDEETKEWRTPYSLEITRSPGDFAAAIVPLLIPAKKVHFIDKGFSVDEDRNYISSLAEIVDGIVAAREPFPEIIFHFCPDKKRESYISGELNDRLVGHIPQDCRFTFRQWTPEDNFINKGAHPFHNRFVLTNFCGVMVGYGCDCARHPTDSPDHLQMLDEEMRVALWRKTEVEGFPGMREENMIVIRGTRKI